MKRSICIFVLIFTLAFSMAACDEIIPTPSTTEPAASTETTVADTKKEEPADALSQLRTAMKPPVIAVANFYFPELTEDFGIMDYLLDEYPQWVEKNEFIRDMPEERIIITCDYEAWGNLVCVVPYDPASTVTVKVVRIQEDADRQESIAYSSGSGEPILLLADISEAVTVSVEVIDSTGRGVTWYPYWEMENPIPEDGYYGHLVMDFTPISEKSAYQTALDLGWFIPDADFLTHHLWASEFGYQLDLYYAPNEYYDGEAYLMERNADGDYVTLYDGAWSYAEGLLHLKLWDFYAGETVLEEAFPILIDPYGEGYVEIYRTEDGVGLPYFYEFMECDTLSPVYDDRTTPYGYAISQGWRLPDLEELLNSGWQSNIGYAMDLTEDGTPGDNGGWATVYDVSESGAYTESYSGTWQYEDGMLHLTLIPVNADGYFVDESFPVLMLDGQLWIGRNSDGLGLPHFYSDMLADVLDQPKG